MKLVYNTEALNDLNETKTYISKVLKNKVAANRITNMIFRNCQSLKTHPRLGMSLEGKTGITSDLRYLSCENWLVFYEVQDDTIRIVRVLDGRTDYLKLLFG